MRRALLLATILVVCLASVVSAGKKAKVVEKSKVDEIVSRLQKRYDSTSDFTADFTQAVEVPSLGKTLKSTGRLFFKRPGRMRWEFQSPEKQMIVADGTTLWLYQPDHHQVLKTPFRAAFQSATPVSFLFGVGELSKDFNPSLLKSEKKGVVRLKLIPKQDTEIGTLVLDVDSSSYDIVAAEVTDPLGNVTRLTFSNMKRGVGLADSQFTFEAPPGTDVVESPGSQ